MFRCIGFDEFMALRTEGEVTASSFGRGSHPDNGWRGDKPVIFAWQDRYPQMHSAPILVRIKEDAPVEGEGIARYHWKDRYSDDCGTQEYPESYLDGYRWDDIKGIEISRSGLNGLIRKFVFPHIFLGNTPFFPRNTWRQSWETPSDSKYSMEELMEALDFLHSQLKPPNIVEIKESGGRSDKCFHHDPNTYYVAEVTSPEQRERVASSLPPGSRIISTDGKDLSYFVGGSPIAGSRQYKRGLLGLSVADRPWPKKTIRDCRDYWSWILNAEG